MTTASLTSVRKTHRLIIVHEEVKFAGSGAEIAAMVAINMVHIAPWAATEGLMRGAGRHLDTGGPLYLYGPYFLQGETALSNVRFDRKLRADNPEWGLREVEKVTEAAMDNGLRLEQVIKMPANNLSVVFRKTAGD